MAWRRRLRRRQALAQGVTESFDHSAAERILSALLEARAGHAMSQDRIWRIETALGPIMRERGMPSLEALVVELATGSDRRLVDTVIDAMINHETYFFRDFELFADIERVALGKLMQLRASQRSLSIWCVGCSTGQEPYSLAMAMHAQPEKWRNWDVRIIASDISPSVINTAKLGRYSHFEIQRGLPATAMLDWFEPDDGDWLLRSVIRDRVDFFQHNILADALPPGPFDLILCRNILFYLTPHYRNKAITRLASALSDDGLLMLGAFETMIGQGPEFERDPDAKGFYRRARPATRPMAQLASR